MRRGRCNCGADAQHEHMLARDASSSRTQGGALSLLGGSSVALNGFIRRPDVRAWNYSLLPQTSNGVHNIFSTPSSKPTAPTVASPSLPPSSSSLGQTSNHANPSLAAVLEQDNQSQQLNNDPLQEYQQDHQHHQHQHPAAILAQNLISLHQRQNGAAILPTTSSSSASSDPRPFAQGSGGGGAEFPDDPSYQTVRSDADQELLVYCPFSEFMNIRAMMVICNPATCPPAEEPSAVQLFVNRQEAHLGFGDVRRAVPAQNLKLGSSSQPGDSIVYALDAGRFRSVSSLTLFFKTSYGGQHTQVSRVVFFGESTREPVFRDIARNVVTEQMADPTEHVRRLQAEANTRALRN